MPAIRSSEGRRPTLPRAVENARDAQSRGIPLGLRPRSWEPLLAVHFGEDASQSGGFLLGESADLLADL